MCSVGEGDIRRHWRDRINMYICTLVREAGVLVCTVHLRAEGGGGSRLGEEGGREREGRGKRRKRVKEEEVEKEKRSKGDGRKERRRRRKWRRRRRSRRRERRRKLRRKRRCLGCRLMLTEFELISPEY